MYRKAHLPKVALLFFVVILLLGRMAKPGYSQPPANDFSELDQYIQDAMQRLPIRGLALAVVRGDQVLYMQGYGTANRAGDPVTPQTPFMLASVSKSFTALAIQQLAAAGKLDLNDPLQDYLPEFQMADRQSAALITIRNLLDHTSGISQSEGTQPYLHSPETTFPEALDLLAGYTPTRQPGEQYEYSNWNFVLLGEVIARVSGQAFADYMQTHVLDPLEMEHASFADYHTLPGAASGNSIAFGLSVPYDEKHVPVQLSAGYLSASAEDMAHYLIPFFNHGQYPSAGSTVSLLPNRERGWYDSNWNWKPGAPGDIAISYSGGHNSFSTGFQIFPLKRVGVAVLMNTRLDTFVPGPTATELALNIARMVLHSPYQTPSNLVFYGGYALIDGFLLLMFVASVWQAVGMKRWASRPRGRAWIGIALNLLVLAGILMLPALAGTDWAFMLNHRTDIGVAFLIAGLLLAWVAAIKIALLLRSKKR